MVAPLARLGLIITILFVSACAYHPRHFHNHPNAGYYPGYGNNRFYPPRHVPNPGPPAYGYWRNRGPNPYSRPPVNNYYQNNYYNRPVYRPGPGYNYRPDHDHHERHEHERGHGRHGWDGWRGRDD